MKKITKQILSIAGLTTFIIGFDASIFTVCTQRCINDFSKEMSAKSVEVSKFLPFDSESEIVIKEGEKLTGDLPVIDGAAALFPVFSAITHRLYPEESVHYVDGEFLSDSSLIYTNTRGAYKGIVDKTSDIIFCARPSKEQLAYAEEKGVELELTPIGHEAFVFLVNVNNKVDSLEVDQIRDIYSGKIKTWNKVGGAHRLCTPLYRNEGSGSQTTMEKFMNGEKMVKGSALGWFGQSIGFSFRYYVEGLNTSSGVKMISVNGISPNKENIQNGTYPIISNIYMVTRKGETNPNVQKVIDYVLSEEGQDIVNETGFVGL